MPDDSAELMRIANNQKLGQIFETGLVKPARQVLFLSHSFIHVMLVVNESKSQLKQFDNADENMN